MKNKKEIAEQLKQYILVRYRDASNSQSSEKYSSLFHKDARWCPPSIPDYIGQGSIKYGFDAKNGNIEVETFVQEVEISEELAFVIGGATVEFFSNDKKTNKKYWHRVIWIFKNKDDSWKIYRQIWNIKKTIDIPIKIFETV